MRVINFGGHRGLNYQFFRGWSAAKIRAMALAKTRRPVSNTYWVAAATKLNSSTPLFTVICQTNAKRFADSTGDFNEISSILVLVLTWDRI